MRKLGLLLGLLLWAASASAQTPPMLMFTPDVLARLDAKVAANHPDWVHFNTYSARPDSCPYLIQYHASTPDNLPNVYAPREPIPDVTPTGSIGPGYLGAGYLNNVNSLGACYFAVRNTDPASAAKYKAQAIKILQKMTSPFATLTFVGTPPTQWRLPSTDPIPSSKSTRAVYYVDWNGTGATHQARIRMRHAFLNTGNGVTLAGVLGCTTANGGPWKVTKISSEYYDVYESDGTTPVICNADGTNYNELPDNTYAMRSAPPAVIQVLSWFWDDISAEDKAQAWIYLNSWFQEYSTLYYTWTNNRYSFLFDSNFTQGYAGALALLAGFGREVNPGWLGNTDGAFWDSYFQWWVANPEAHYAERWCRNNYGNPESWHYHSADWADGAIQYYDMTGVDIASDLSQPFEWIEGNALYFIYNTAPNMKHGALRGFNFSHGFWTGTEPGMWTAYQPRYFWRYLYQTGRSALASRFLAYIREGETINAGNKAERNFRETKLSRLLWDDASLPVDSDWRTGLPLSDPEGSSPTNDYLRVVGRSDWGSDAVAFDFFAGPMTSSEGNSKEHYDQGALYVQKGDAYLLVPPMASAAREQCGGDCYRYFNAVWNKEQNRNFYGLYYTERQADGYVHVPDFDFATHNNQPGSDVPPPWGNTISSAPDRIDRYEDQTSYVYMRAVDQYDHFGKDNDYTTDRPVGAWTREIIYLRPDLFVVYDRTRKDEVAHQYEQFLAWSAGKTPTVASYGGAFWRTTVNDTDTSVYKGALTHILPINMPEPSVEDLLGYGKIFQVRQRPEIETHGTPHQQYVNWLNVVQPASSSGDLAHVALFSTRSNIDVIGLSNDKVVGFPDSNADESVTLPMTYTMTGMDADTVTHWISGLTASAIYNVSVSGSDVSIASSGGGTSYAATAGGVLVFETGPGGGDPPVVLNTSSVPRHSPPAPRSPRR